MSSRTRPHWAVLTALLVGLAAFVAQVPAIRDVFLWDDVYMFRGNDLYTNPDRFAEAALSPLGKATPYWRPLATTSFLAESLVHGGSAAGFRATAALLFGACAGLAFLLLARTSRSPGADADSPSATRASIVVTIAALAFAWHPVHVETATWIAARFDLLAGGLTIAALLVATGGTADGAAGGGVPSRSRCVAVGALTAAAALSKEWALLLPAVVPLVVAAAAAPAPGRASAALRAARPLAFAAAWGVGAVLLVRAEVMPGTLPAGASWDAAGPAPLGPLLLVGRSFLGTVGSIAAPASFVGPIHWGPRPIPSADAAAWTGLAMLLATAAAAAYAWRRRPRTGLLLTALLLAWLPTSQILPISIAGPADTADRFQFLTTFLAIATAADLASASAAASVATRRLFLPACVVLAGLLALRTWDVTRWNDGVRFWEWASDRAPESVFARGHLARAALEAGDAERAEALARRNESVDPEFLAEVLADRSKLADARGVLDAAVARGAATRRTLLVRGRVLARLGATAEAIADFDAVVAAERDAADVPDPLAAVALAEGAETLAATGDRAGAASRAARAAEAAGTRDGPAWAALTRTYRRLGDALRASDAADRALAAGADARELQPRR